MPGKFSWIILMKIFSLFLSFWSSYYLNIGLLGLSLSPPLFFLIFHLFILFLGMWRRTDFLKFIFQPFYSVFNFYFFQDFLFCFFFLISVFFPCISEDMNESKWHGALHQQGHSDTWKMKYWWRGWAGEEEGRWGKEPFGREGRERNKGEDAVVRSDGFWRWWWTKRFWRKSCLVLWICNFPFAYCLGELGI